VDVTNQLKVLVRRDFVDVFGKKRKSFLCGLTDKGRLVKQDVLANTPEPSHSTNSHANGQVNDWSPADQFVPNFAANGVADKMSVACVVIMSLSNVNAINCRVRQFHARARARTTSLRTSLRM